MNNEELSLLLGMSDQLQAAVYNGTFKQSSSRIGHHI
jgi:hypothetical protein